MSSIRTRLTTALPALLAALLYYLALEGVPAFLGVPWRDFVILLQVEGLVIHSFFFLGLLWIILARKKGSWPVEVIFWLLFLLYLGMSLNYGAKGPLYFIAATLATYPVSLLPRQLEPKKERTFHQVLYSIFPEPPPKSRFPRMDDASFQALVLRWAVCAILYFGMLIFFGLGNQAVRWQVTPSVFRMGAAYFLVLGLLEAAGFYELERWKRLAERFRRWNS